jgi:hypothetical protein
MVKILKDSFLWAIQDQSADWYLDTKTGEVRSDLEGFGDDGEPGPEDDERWIEIDRLMPTESFEFMEDFVSELPEGEAREALSSALGGKGSFRRFRDALARFPDVRTRWNEYEDKRLTETAREFLDAIDIQYELTDAP